MKLRSSTRPKLTGQNLIGLALFPAAAVSLAAHPRATLPILLLTIVLLLARLPRLATCMLTVLLVATFLGARVDAAPHATPRTPSAVR